MVVWSKKLSNMTGSRIFVREGDVLMRAMSLPFLWSTKLKVARGVMERQECLLRMWRC